MLIPAFISVLLFSLAVINGEGEQKKKPDIVKDLFLFPRIVFDYECRGYHPYKFRNLTSERLDYMGYVINYLN